MSINLIRFLASQKKRAERYHTDALRYRGVVYKEIDWFRKSGLGSAMLPFSIWHWPVRGHPLPNRFGRRP